MAEKEVNIGQIWEESTETEKLGFLAKVKEALGFKDPVPEKKPKEDPTMEAMQAEYERLKANESMLTHSGELAWETWVKNVVEDYVKKGNIPAVAQEKAKEVFTILRGAPDDLSAMVIETMKAQGKDIEEFGEAYTKAVADKTAAFAEFCGMLKSGLSVEESVKEDSPAEGATNESPSDKLDREVNKRLKERGLPDSDYMRVAEEVKKELEIKDI